MANRQGDFIWYELMTSDMDGARGFYEAVMGCAIDARTDMPGMDYRMIRHGDAFIGGAMPLDAEMAAHGARPIWLGYIAVADVDAMAQAIAGAGGKILMPPTDIPDVGRFCMASDPQGAPFYIMRGASEGTSTVFAENETGRWGWNELWTPDPDAALAFYAGLFGWRQDGAMPMGPAGDYRFLYQGETRIGALGPRSDVPPAWRFYFRVPSIAAAAEAIATHGGTIVNGPHVVPGGDSIVVGRDPQGAEFGLVGDA